MPKIKILRTPIKAKSGSTLSAGKAREILHDGTAQGHPITDKQRRYFGFVAGGGKPKADDGASVTPLSKDVIQFNGASHEDGGIPIKYGGKKVEVEGAETGYKSPVDGSLHIMGNMQNPLTGRKFKEDSKRLAEKERKTDKLISTSTELINKNDPTDKWGNLAFNSGKVMLTGGLQKKKELADNKEWLATLQKLMLQHANEIGVDPQEFSKGKLTKAKNGVVISQDGSQIPSFYNTGKPSTIKDKINMGLSDFLHGNTKPTYMENTTPTQTSTPVMASSNTQQTSNNSSPWDFRGTNTQGLDEKIMNFLPLLQKHGLTGFSGPESGVSQRNTLSGRLSRHAQKQALDAFISQPDAYNKVLNNPELSKYLIDNGLTLINEYDPNVAKQTGATEGHLHIGYDQGTALSNKFRQDAASLYKDSNPDWGWGNILKPKGKALQTSPAGDVQNFGPDTDFLKFPTIPFDPNSINYPETSQPRITPGDNYNLTLNQPLPYSKPSNATRLQADQILPELYTAAVNKPEPVWMQQFRPQLFQPYKVSFQDRLNANQADFNAMLKSNAHNPAAQASLAAQKYEANNAIGAEEFRTNQGIEQDIVNKNISLLNDAQQKNLALADTQYTRQAATKSKVREQNLVVLDSISDKIRQHQLENRTLQVYENMYPNYSFDEKNNMNLKYSGPNGADWINWGEVTPEGGDNPATVKKYDASNKLQWTRLSTSDSMKHQLEKAELLKKNLDLYQERKRAFTPTIQQSSKYKAKLF